MTLRRAEVNEGRACLPCAGKKRRVVSGRDPSTSCGKPENAFAFFEIFQEKAVLATLSNEFVN